MDSLFKKLMANDAVGFRSEFAQRMTEDLAKKLVLLHNNIFRDSPKDKR